MWKLLCWDVACEYVDIKIFSYSNFNINQPFGFYREKGSKLNCPLEGATGPFVLHKFILTNLVFLPIYYSHHAIAIVFPTDH